MTNKRPAAIAATLRRLLDLDNDAEHDAALEDLRREIRLLMSGAGQLVIAGSSSVYASTFAAVSAEFARGGEDPGNQPDEQATIALARWLDLVAPRQPSEAP